LRRLSAVIAGHPHDRADRASHCGAIHRQPDIHGQPYAVTHWHVHRLDTTRRVNDHVTDPRRCGFWASLPVRALRAGPLA
jgi:hypothetical protein